MSKIALGIALIWIVSAMGTIPAVAQSHGEPGKFDYYLLSLSWSPEYCATHRDIPAARQECGPGRQAGFVLHGLWPQFAAGGWPESCRKTDRLPQLLVDGLLPIMPGEGLIRHEWAVHGTCSGVAVDAYFDLLTRAFRKIRIPDSLIAPRHETRIGTDRFIAAFADANPGLRRDAMALSCGSDHIHLREIRICLDRRLTFRDCGAEIADSCGAQLRLVPISGQGS